MRFAVGSFAAVGALVASPAPAQAQDAACPPGSWFCADAPPAPAAPAPLPPAEAPAAPPAAAPAPAPAPPPPVVVYQPPPPPVVVVAPRAAPQVYHYTPRPAIPHRQWGLNLHVAGIALGSGRNGEAAMGLVGLGLRFRPVPGFALEANIDVAGGTDYNGFRRTETLGTLNGLLYLNPKSRAQFYLLGGLGLSGARVSGDDYAYLSSSSLYSPGDRKYTYFGGQGGAGIEIRLSRVVALNFDIRGFVRSRTDGRGAPEFVDSSGRTTNTSGGALVNGGITFYF
ncbi:MAG: hypothetical protein IPF92_08415 [Myxococcales bacterium]|nr:hypothetical protein [Myxococcales bacterium]HQY60370.1 hypothetical protein [Polyangiaceae bacterium]